MNLSDLTPVKTDFTVNVTDQNGDQVPFELTLRPYTLGDESWAERKYGGASAILSIFQQMKKTEICQIVFNQLTLASKKKITAQKFDDVGEDGEVFEIKLSGPQKIENLIAGVNEFISLYNALCGCKGISQPMIDKAVEDELKKNGVVEKDSEPTGQPSLT